jgi:phenylalanyl-tRNA synthetase beta chain
LFETSLEVVAHNLNHKNNSLRLFEFGNAYSTSGLGKYTEAEKLCIVISGNKNEDSWKQKSISADFYSLKGTVDAVLKVLGIASDSTEVFPVPKLANHIVYKLNNQIIAGAGEVKKNILDKFGIKQPVFFVDFNWAVLSELASQNKKTVKEISKYPAMQRDVAMIVPKELAWEQVQQTVEKIKLNKLQEIKLFDIFESEKLGTDKKSVAVNFTFLDEEKTLTDKEIDGWMGKIMATLEKDLQAEIRK